jgi:uncharacterized protein YndB with AHSA1/START domain
MTEHRSFKRLVRARMAKTGESYTAARVMLLKADSTTGPAEVRLATSDERIRGRTGRGWEEWFRLLDEWGAADRTHRETARWVAEQQQRDPLAWNVQAVVSSFERARGVRAEGEKDDGFAITVSRTIAVPVDQLYDAVVDASERRQWLPDTELSERTATRPRSARFDGSDGRTRVNLTFLEKGGAKSTVALEHRRLADAEAARQMKAFWRERLDALKLALERAG